MSPQQIHRELRGRIAQGLIALVFITIGIGLFRLQIQRHSELLNQSENNRIRVQPIVPKRGVIRDRFNTELVDNRVSHAISIVRSELDRYTTISRLSELIGFDSTLIMDRLRKNREPRYLPAVIKRDVEFEKIAILEEQYQKYPGITHNEDPVRRYTAGISSQCFTGYVGEVTGQTKFSGQTKLREGSLIGKQGIEKEYDEYLRGREGTRSLEISAKGVVLGDLADRPPDLGMAGADLILTIDAELQRAAANSFDTFCCGAIVALNPKNGELLAIVSKPDYDANIFSGVILTDVWNKILNDPRKPLLNRPLDGRYPPASPFKLVTAGGLLEEGIVTDQTVFEPCRGGWQFGRRWFRCWKLAGHGTRNVVRAIAESCDTYFYQAGLKLGIDKLAEYTRACGFGAPTGIDLPHENSGLVPNSDTLNRMYPDGWTKALTLNLSIGQGELLVTPLQVAQFFAGLVNKGTVYKPHLLKTIILPDGSRVSPPPQVSFQLPFSPKTLEILNQGMFAVVHSVDGTAEGIAVAEYNSGGKTGTAQNPHGENHSWYVGFAPFEDPQIVIVVIVENGGHGSSTAAPMVGKLLKFYLELRTDLAQTGEKEESG